VLRVRGGEVDIDELPEPDRQLPSRPTRLEALNDASGKALPTIGITQTFAGLSVGPAAVLTAVGLLATPTIGAPVLTTKYALALAALTDAAPMLPTPILPGAVALGFVSMVTSPASGTVHVGSDITFTLTFDRAVTVSGTPELYLNTGGKATYQSGSGSSTLVYKYTVGGGDSNQATLRIVGSNPYNTNFRNVENPISESGAWTYNVNATAAPNFPVAIVGNPNRAIGTDTIKGGTNDSVAHLQGWQSNDYTLNATVYLAPGIANRHHEAELLAHVSETAYGYTLYEATVSNTATDTTGYDAGASGSYEIFVRWDDGPSNSYTVLRSIDPLPSFTLVDGAKFRFVVSGNTFAHYVDLNDGGGYKQIGTTTLESTYPTGQPGIGFCIYNMGGTEPDAPNDVYGYRTFNVSAAGAALQNSGNDLPTIGITQTFTGLSVGPATNAPK
jgi:hypothetical protein